jgi:formamidopyrimidine-DNA glycosylase
MPELPEVETTKRGIGPHVLGQRVVAVHVYDSRLRWPIAPGLPEAIVGQRVERLDRRSKYLLFGLSDGTLLVHLGMTGSLRAHTAEAELPPRRTHDHVDIFFANGVTLRYHDPRRFGSLLWLGANPGAHALLSKLGPEPLSGAFNADYLHAATRSRRAGIKPALMDNALVVGVGNIYANESLFRAGVHPKRAANRIGLARLSRVVDAVQATLEEAIAAGGSTLRDYVGSSGERGGFQLTYAVYAREGLPCPTCGTPIRAVRQGQRSSFYCPTCQT